MHSFSISSSVLLSKQMDRFHADKVAAVVSALGLPKNEKLSDSTRRALASRLEKLDKNCQIDGVDFSRAQLDELFYSSHMGMPIEFETLGPYLADYLKNDGRITRDNLIAEDEIGL